MNYNVKNENERIIIGEVGENLAESCTIDYSAWVEEYGEGNLRIRAIREGDAEPYPVASVETADGVATWTYTAADTAVKGFGEVQVLYYVGDVLAKSRVWKTYTYRSLNTSSEEVPDPYADWLNAVERIGGQVEADAEAASASADSASASATLAAGSASAALGSASAASTSAESAESSASAASRSATEASNYEYYSEQYMNEAKSAKFGAESARTGAENAKAAAQASATAAAQSAAQAEETAESIEASADLIQKLLANQIHDTATGTIATYPDGADMPMVSLVADIDPIQDLHGYDRPWLGGGGASKIPFESVIEEGWTRTLNGITATFSQGYMKVTGTSTSSGWTNIVDLTPWASPDFFYLPAGTYSVAEHLTIKGYVDGTYANFSEAGRTVTQQFNVMGFYIAVRSGETVDWNIPMMFVSDSTRPTAYEPYTNICPISGWDSVETHISPTTDAQDGQTITTTLPQTVYGGTLDVVSGVLTVDRAMVDLDNTTRCGVSSQTSDVAVFDAPFINNQWENHSSTPNAISNRFSTSTPSGNAGRMVVLDQHLYFVIAKAELSSIDESGARAWMNDHPTQFSYELATPQTYQLTPTQIDSLLGRNNVWADSGDVTVEYIADTKLYIQKVIS